MYDFQQFYGSDGILSGSANSKNSQSAKKEPLSINILYSTLTEPSNSNHVKGQAVAMTLETLHAFRWNFLDFNFLQVWCPSLLNMTLLFNVSMILGTTTAENLLVNVQAWYSTPSN